MKRGMIVFFILLMGIVFFTPTAWAQSIVDITWTPTSPVAGESVRFVVKVVNSGPKAPICIGLFTRGGSPDSQTHPGIGIRRGDLPINVAFGPVTYASPGEYEVKAGIMDKNCEKFLVGIPYRKERIKIGAPTK